jgi:hypothetical protein
MYPRKWVTCRRAMMQLGGRARRRGCYGHGYKQNPFMEGAASPTKPAGEPEIDDAAFTWSERVDLVLG